MSIAPAATSTAPPPGDGVRMQIIVLQATIASLHAKGKMPTDVSEMMKDLIAVFENKPQRAKVIPVVKITPSLPKAQMYEATCDYIGPTLAHLMIRKGDSVIVYGSLENSQVRIGYNSRTKMGGRFPADVVNYPTDTEIDYQLLICTAGGIEKFDQLKNEVGDYIRVCRWDQLSVCGYGLNQRTLELGHFHMNSMRKTNW